MKIHFYNPDDSKKKPKSRPLPKPRNKKSDFTLDWISELGWRKSPFEEEGFSIADMEDERQELNLFFIKKKHFGTITGGEGMGKSTLLYWTEGELKRFKGMEVYLIDAKEATNDKQLLKLLADPFRGIFNRGTDIDKDSLIELISKKVRGHYVLLIDNADLLSVTQVNIIEALLHLDCTILCACNKKMIRTPYRDELALTLKKRKPSEYVRILQDRIESVGGREIHPFTEKVVKQMASDTGTVRDFLKLAQETAINIALKRVVLEDEESEEDIAESQADKVEKSKGIERQEEAGRSGKKRKYDELIESLSGDD